MTDSNERLNEVVQRALRIEEQRNEARTIASGLLAALRALVAAVDDVGVTMDPLIETMQEKTVAARFAAMKAEAAGIK